MPNGGNNLVFKNAGSEGMKDSDLVFKSHKSNKSNRGIIVGYDPGLTVGIAIINLHGELISLNSYKEIRRSEIISHIIEYGRTVLVATDVYPAPKSVRKIASTLNSKIWSPYKNMSVESKIEIVDSFISNGNNLMLPQNAHERDALAAALKTFKDHQNKFRQIEKRAEKLSLSADMVDQIKIMVINGKSISNSIREISEDNLAQDINYERDDRNLRGNKLTYENKGNTPGDSPKKTAADIVGTDDREGLSQEQLTINRLKNKLNSQKRHINDLNKKNKNLEDEIKKQRLEISKIQSKMDKLRNEYNGKILEKKVFTSKIDMIKRLQKKYSEEKALRLDLELKLNSNTSIDKLPPDAVPIRIIGSFTKDGIKESEDKKNILKGDIVLLENSEGGGSNTATIISEMGVKAVITMDKISDPAEKVFLNHMIPLIPVESIKIYHFNDVAYVKPEDIDFQIKNWLEKTLEQKKTDDKNKLINLVDEYRAQRRRELDK